MTILDVSVPISNQTPVFPGDPPVKVERTSDVNKGDRVTLSRVEMGTHTATHLDAPLHFIKDGATVGDLPLERLVGPVHVLDLTGVQGEIKAADLERAKLAEGTTRILCKTRDSWLWTKPGFQKDFTAFAPDAAQWLVAHNVRLVGIDYLSAESFGAEEAETHHILLGAGVIIVEGLDLRDAAPGAYTLVCLPLKLENVEGAPCRAILVSGSLG